MKNLIVAGGGSAGVAAAVSAARNGCKVILIEKLSFLGGTSTGALVTPMMKNMIDNDINLTSGIYLEILQKLRETGHAATHENGNPGWFDTEMMKCALDDLCEENGVEVLFDTVITGVNLDNNIIKSINVHNKSGNSTLEAKFFIDTTGDADLAAYAGVPFESGEDGHNQAFSLRFIMSGIDLEKFGNWLMEIDPDSGVSSVCKGEQGQLLVSTAYTSEDKDWKLKPYFKKGIDEGILKPEDAAYFQVFSMPGQNTSISFNCPRVYADRPLNPLDMWDISYAYKMGRKQIRRISEFCKKYFAGFENASISQIAPLLGIRDSRRIKGEYKLTEDDILNAKKFNHTAAKSNYPVDIHSLEKGKSELKFLPENDYYEIPAEALKPKNIENLLVAGRCISATFRAQASLRIQPNCWATGETAGKMAAQTIQEN